MHAFDRQTDRRSGRSRSGNRAWSGDTEISWSAERLFGRSRSAHMLCSHPSSDLNFNFKPLNRYNSALYCSIALKFCKRGCIQSPCTDWNLPTMKSKVGSASNFQPLNLNNSGVHCLISLKYEISVLFSVTRLSQRVSSSMASLGDVQNKSKRFQQSM